MQVSISLKNILERLYCLKGMYTFIADNVLHLCGIFMRQLVRHGTLFYYTELLLRGPTVVGLLWSIITYFFIIRLSLIHISEPTRPY